MKFSRRLKLFLFGVFIGLLIVYFSLIRGRDRDLMGWLPKERVLQQLRENELAYTQHGKCSMECSNISKEEIQQILLSGEVSFDKSRVKETPCPVYALEGKVNERSLIVMFAACAKETQVVNAVDVNSEVVCECEY